jgi:hypothetical protein
VKDTIEQVVNKNQRSCLHDKVSENKSFTPICGINIKNDQFFGSWFLVTFGDMKIQKILYSLKV